MNWEELLNKPVKFVATNPYAESRDTKDLIEILYRVTMSRTLGATVAEEWERVKERRLCRKPQHEPEVLNKKASRS